MHPSSLIMLLLAGSFIVSHGFNVRELVQNMVIAAEGKDRHRGVHVDRSLEGHAIFHHLNKKFGGKSHKPALFKTFTWSDCGSKDEVANVTKIDVSPDPVILPGTLSVSFTVGLKQTVDAPLKMSIHMEKDIIFGWVTIPCIDGIGSCTYDDVCEKLMGATCPPEFVDQGIPCKCPFTQGNYNFPTASYSIDQSVPSGKYKATVKLTQSGNPVACLAIAAELE